jgi:hypothetical protein
MKAGLANINGELNSALSDTHCLIDDIQGLVDLVLEYGVQHDFQEPCTPAICSLSGLARLLDSAIAQHDKVFECYGVSEKLRGTHSKALLGREISFSFWTASIATSLRQSRAIVDLLLWDCLGSDSFSGSHTSVMASVGVVRDLLDTASNEHESMQREYCREYAKPNAVESVETSGGRECGHE